MRTIVWVGLGILALNVLLFSALVLTSSIRQFRIARSRRQLEHLGHVVLLPSAIATRPRWPRWVAGVACLAALVIALSMLTTARSDPTETSAASSSIQEGPSATDVTVGTRPGTDHPPPHDAAASPGVASPQRSATSSTSPAVDAGAPSTVAALPTSATTIRLEWAPVSDASRYDIERSTDSVAWNAVGSTDGGETAYMDEALSSGTTYYYRVGAIVDGQGASISDTVSATTTVDISTPPVLISATGSATSIGLVWSDVDGELGYRIERSPDGTSGWIGIGTTGQDVTSYIDTGLSPATSYYYRVVAVMPDGESPPSTVMSASTDPDAPST